MQNEKNIDYVVNSDSDAIYELQQKESNTTKRAGDAAQGELSSTSRADGANDKRHRR